jgi:O-antigen/teichoic acid export membrane protein
VQVNRSLLVAYRALADLSAKGSFFLITILAARRLSQQAFGVFSLASTLGWILAVAADFGIQLHLARSVARRPADAPRLLRRWLTVRLWTASASVLLVAGWIAATGWGPDGLPIVLFVAVYAGAGLVEFLHYFYRGLSRTDVESSLTLTQRAATLAIAAAVLIWRPGLTTLAFALLAPVVATLAASLRIAARLSRSNADTLPSISPAPASRNLSAEFKREVLPIGAGIVLSALYFRIDIFLVELWQGTAAVALYNAVFRLVEALRLFPAAVLAVTLPELCRASDRRPLVQVSLAVTLVAAVSSVALWLASGWLIPMVYGVDYAGAVPAFRILVLSFPLLSLNYALTHQLIGWDGERIYAAICAAALVVNVALNARLIPALSIDGAAWATFGTEAFLTAACLLALPVVTTRAREVSSGAAI